MDNGAGAITGTHLAEMNPVEEEILESKFDNRVVAGLHEPKDSDGDEVFEEVIEGNLDDVTLASNGFSVDISAHDVFFEDSNLPAVDQICGVSHVGEMVEDATAAADDVGSPAKEGLENGQNSLVADGVHELLVANVNYKGGTASEGVPTNGEKVINEDSGIATVNDSGSIKEVVTEKLRVVDNFRDENNDKELMVVSEREASKDNQYVEEKSVQVSVLNHMLETRDAEGMEPAHGIACQKSQIDGLLLQDGKVHDLKDVGTVVGKNHLDEAYREPRLTSAGISPEEQTNEFEKKEALAGGSEEDIVEFLDASAGSKVEHEESNDASHGDDSHGIEEVVWDDETSKEPDDQITLLSDERGGSLELNDNSSVKVTSFEKSASQVPDKEKSDTVTTIPGIDKSDTNQIGHAEAGVSATCNPNIVEEYAKEDRVDKEDRKYQTSRETKMKPVAAVASPPGPSSNPALPSTRPAGLGHGVPLLEPTHRLVQQPRANGTTSHVQAQLVEGSANGEPEEGDETREKLQMIRVKFLRLAHRLGQTPHNVVVAQVLYRLGLAEQLRGRNGARTGNFSFDRASAMAEQLEATGQEPLDFSCTIMVLGKTGVGKSATINSIFDEVKFSTDAFQSGTKKVQDVVGTVQGIKVRVIDTPGLLPSWSDQRQNGKILHSVKRFIKKSPPDIILYLDRLDMQSRDLGDMLLLRTITDTFGPSIWFNAIVVLTHAATAPPDGPNGVASSYEMLVTQRSHVVQNAIRQAAGDMRLMNPVALVENHSACRTNRAGQRVLPNGQVWKPHLLLLSFASKILAEANTLLKLQDTPPGKPFPTRSRTPPLPFLLSSLLQSRPQLKLPEEQFGDDDEDAFDDDLDDSSDSDDESEYDELPPFKRLTNAQLAKLTKDQRKSYYDELEYREKLFMKKQLKEEKKRRKMMKKMAAAARDMPNDYAENVEDESGAAASVPVPMPDLALPASFDADNPTHRYRCLDNSNQWLVRPVLDSHGWDHDVGYEGINAERLFVVKNKIPLSVSGQVSKDKKEANVQMEVSSSMKHGEGKGTTVGFDMQSAGKEMAYTLRSETRFSNYRHNKATAGISATLLGDTMSAGLKVEDKLIVNKRFRMVMSGGAMTSRGDVAYGGSLEASLRDKDYPLGRFLSTLGLSVMDWHGDLAIGCNVQSQIPVGRFTNLIARGNLNNRGSGQVSIRLNSSEQIQIALIGLIPLIQKMIGQPQQHPYGH